MVTRKVPARWECYINHIESRKPNASEIMVRRLCSFLLILASWCAYAQSSGAEPPVEHASLLTVAIFIFVFVAACVGYVGFTWWRGRKKED